MPDSYPEISALWRLTQQSLTQLREQEYQPRAPPHARSVRGSHSHSHSSGGSVGKFVRTDTPKNRARNCLRVWAVASSVERETALLGQGACPMLPPTSSHNPRSALLGRLRRCARRVQESGNREDRGRSLQKEMPPRCKKQGRTCLR